MGEEVWHEVMAKVGNNLEVWKVRLVDLHEQDRNARSLSPRLFNQLVENIQRDQRLESLPLVALVNGQLEIISGHHRTRAARKAELEEIFVLVDVSSDMTRSRLVSKQLSHNSIQGIDNEDVLVELYEEIDSIDDMIASAIDIGLLGERDPVEKMDFSGISISPDFHMIVFSFMPTQLDSFEDVVAKIGDVESLYVFPTEFWEKLRTCMLEVGTKCEIVNITAQLAKMVEIVTEYMSYFGEDEEGKMDEGKIDAEKTTNLIEGDKSTLQEKAMAKMVKGKTKGS